MIKYNLSEYIMRGILSQYDNKRFLRPYIYFLKKNSPVKCNYKIHDKELLAVIQYFEKWNAEL